MYVVETSLKALNAFSPIELLHDSTEAMNGFDSTDIMIAIEKELKTLSEMKGPVIIDR